MNIDVFFHQLLANGRKMAMEKFIATHSARNEIIRKAVETRNKLNYLIQHS